MDRLANLPNLNCPSTAADIDRWDSDPQASTLSTGYGTGTPNPVQVKCADYGATTGVARTLATNNLIQFAGPGLMPQVDPTLKASRLQTASSDFTPAVDATDGLSNTVALAESAGRPLGLPDSRWHGD